MKKKYFIGILIIAILVFAGVEIFRRNASEEVNNNETNIKKEKTEINGTETKDTENINQENSKTNETPNSSEKNNQEKITNGEEMIKEAKTITASGWAGASNNVIGLKDGILYYYNKATGEFKALAEGIEDIYCKTEYAEEITAKKGNNFKEINEKPIFVEYE